MSRVLNHHYVRVYSAPFVELMSTESVHDIGSDRSEESCGSADTALMRASRGINIVFPDLLKATDDCRRRPIGLRADAQIEDDGPKHGDVS